QDTLGDRLLEISLECAPWHSRGDRLERLQVSVWMLHEVEHQSLLACVEAMLHSYYISFDAPPAALSHLIHFRGQSLNKVIEPPSQAHPLLSHALQRRVEIRPVTIVVLADREQPLEVVASPIQAERRQQP